MPKPIVSPFILTTADSTVPVVKAGPTNEEIAATYASHIATLDMFETAVFDGSMVEYETRIKLTDFTKTELANVLGRYDLAKHVVMASKFGTRASVLLLIRPKTATQIQFSSLTKKVKESPVKGW